MLFSQPLSASGDGSSKPVAFTLDWEPGTEILVFGGEIPATFSWTLYTMSGNPLMSGDTGWIDCSGLPSGTYVVVCGGQFLFFTV